MVAYCTTAANRPIRRLPAILDLYVGLFISIEDLKTAYTENRLNIGDVQCFISFIITLMSFAVSFDRLVGHTNK